MTAAAKIEILVKFIIRHSKLEDVLHVEDKDSNSEFDQILVVISDFRDDKSHCVICKPRGNKKHSGIGGFKVEKNTRITKDTKKDVD